MATRWLLSFSLSLSLLWPLKFYVRTFLRVVPRPLASFLRFFHLLALRFASSPPPSFRPPSFCNPAFLRDSVSVALGYSFTAVALRDLDCKKKGGPILCFSFFFFFFGQIDKFDFFIRYLNV